MLNLGSAHMSACLVGVLAGGRCDEFIAHLLGHTSVAQHLGLSGIDVAI